MKTGMIRSLFISWLKNDKQVFSLVLLIWLYMYVISPLKTCSEYMQQPLCFAETFMSFIGNGFCMPLIALAFLVITIDYPDISGNVTFVLHRCGRKKWYNNQLFFLILAVIIYLLFLFIFSIVFTGTYSFVTNGWSNVIINLNKESIEEYRQLKITYPFAATDLSIINHFRPYTALFYNTILAILMLVFHGQLQMCLSVRFNKAVGCVSSIAILGLGLMSWVASDKLKWFFPLANSTIGWHYDELYQKTLYPVEYSFVYMIALNIILYIIGVNIVHKKQFYLGGNTYD